MSTSKKRRPPSAYHHGDLEAALLGAARGIVEKDGPAALSLREAARRAGVSHNAPYRHFKSREALLAAVAERGFAAFGAALAAARDAAPAERKVAALGLAYFRFALENRGLLRLMFSDLIDKASHPALAAAATRAFETLRGAVAPVGDPAGRIRALRAWAIVHGLAQLVLDGAIPAQDPDWPSPAALAERVLGGGAP